MEKITFLIEATVENHSNRGPVKGPEMTPEQFRLTAEEHIKKMESILNGASPLKWKLTPEEIKN